MTTTKEVKKEVCVEKKERGATLYQGDHERFMSPGYKDAYQRL